MMAKKAKQESQAEQSERFRKAVEEIEAAGGVSPTDADERFKRFLSEKSVHPPKIDLKSR
jgi:hypothetical protein